MLNQLIMSTKERLLEASESLFNYIEIYQEAYKDFFAERCESQDESKPKSLDELKEFLNKNNVHIDFKPYSYYQNFADSMTYYWKDERCYSVSNKLVDIYLSVEEEKPVGVKVYGVLDNLKKHLKEMIKQFEGASDD